MDSLDIQATIMAIREELMTYFKGTCIDKLTESTNVRLRDVSMPRSYQFERRQAQNERPRMLWIGDVPILTVKQSPDRIIFHTDILIRSPQMKQTQKGIEDFINRYLVGVEREYENAVK